MDLFISIRRVPGLTSPGRIYDLTEDGMEEMTCREENGKRIPTGYTGIILPYKVLEEAVIRLARRGQKVDNKVNIYLNK